MPQSNIDILSPWAGTTQPLQFTVNVNYRNESTKAAFVRITCSFADGGGAHTAVSKSLPANSSGPVDATFNHATGQTNVSVEARLTEQSDGYGELFASALNGDLTIAAPANQPVIIAGPVIPPGFKIYQSTGAEGEQSPLRLETFAGKPLPLSGTYDPGAGKDNKVHLIISGGNKRRPHAIHILKGDDFTYDVVNKAWTAAISKEVLDGQHPQGIHATLVDKNQVYVSSTSIGVSR